MAKAARSPFDVPLSDSQRKTVEMWLSSELNDGLAARSATEVEVDYWHALYEQARTRSAKNLPWVDAADLTSYIPCEKVDSIHARIMRTIWVNPVWTVEGWGTAASRAPFVEEFHQWKAEEERLQSVLDKVALTALIEPRCLLEISESSEERRSRKERTVVPQTTPEGGVIFNEQGQPQLQTNEDGDYIDATAEQLGVTIVSDASEVVRTGPQYRIIPYRDSVVLPGHARDPQEIWAYGKRFWPRLVELRRRAKDGLYDVEQVEKLTTTGDRESDADLALRRSGTSVASSRPETAEKELWEVLLLIDLNAVLDENNTDQLTEKTYGGSRWYLATFHLPSATLLRFQHDDFERSRYVLFNLFPRPDRATEGFSLIGHKLITTAEEHTAYRNMAADKSAMCVSAPVTKLFGGLWDEDEQPMGPKAVLTVRDHREIQQLQFSDVPASVFQHIERAERTSDRLAGVNDIASGQISAETRTLGEVQMATEQAFVRMDLVTRRFQEAMEDVAQIRHAIWKRVLAEQQDGLEAPESVLVGLEGRGVSIDPYLPGGKITAALLDGAFRFRPFGSVETADLNRVRNDFIGMMKALPMMLQAFPMLVPMFQTPQAARAMGRQFLRVFRVQNQQAFLGSPSQDLSQQMNLDQMPMPAMAPPPGMGMPGPMPPGQPGMPPGLPPQIAAMLGGGAAGGMASGPAGPQ